MPFSFYICQIRTQLSFVQYHSCNSFNIRQRNKIKSRPTTTFHSENRLLFIDRINSTSYIWSYPIRPSLFILNIHFSSPYNKIRESWKNLIKKKSLFLDAHDSSRAKKKRNIEIRTKVFFHSLPKYRRITRRSTSSPFSLRCETLLKNPLITWRDT